MRTGRIHAGKLETSPRLKRVLEVLKHAGARGATTMEIVQAAQVCAVNSIIAELRQNGLAISCKSEGLNDQGAHVYRYFLNSSPVPGAAVESDCKAKPGERPVLDEKPPSITVPDRVDWDRLRQRDLFGKAL